MIMVIGSLCLLKDTDGLPNSHKKTGVASNSLHKGRQTDSLACRRLLKRKHTENPDGFCSGNENETKSTFS